MAMAIAEGEAEDVSREASAGDENTPVWSALPKEVQQTVLSHLPIRSLCQMRCVCKEWRDVIHRRDFRTMYDTVHILDEPSPAICYMESSHPARLECSSYDYAGKKWRPITSRSRLCFNPRHRQTWPHSFYSVGGLLCLYFWKADNKSPGYLLGVSSWIVWQPLRNMWKKLPPCQQILSNRGTCFVHAWASEEQGTKNGYKILMAHDPRSHWDEDIYSKLVTQIYNSATGSWQQREEYRLRLSEGYESGRHIRRGVLCNGVIHFSTGSTNCVLLSYDIARDQWHEDARNRDCNVVFEWDGRLMSITSPEADDFATEWNHEGSTYAVVERNPASRTWEHTGIQIPLKVRRKFSSVAALAVVARGNDLAMFGHAEDNSFKTAVYKRAENYWRLPPTGTFSDRLRSARVAGFVLHKPQLNWTP